MKALSVVLVVILIGLCVHGSLLPIIYLGNPLLRAKSTEYSVQELKTNVKELQNLALDMRDTLRKADGVGLAGPQVALSRRVFVVECDCSQILPGPLPFLALFNPVVDTNASQGKDPVIVQEGCLSVPDMRACVSRPSDVTVTFYDIFEQRLRKIHATGYIATIMQHENDHLDGVFYIDKMDPTTVCSTIPDETGVNNCDKYHSNEGTRKGTWELLD